MDALQRTEQTRLHRPAIAPWPQEPAAGFTPNEGGALSQARDPGITVAQALRIAWPGAAPVPGAIAAKTAEHHAGKKRGASDEGERITLVRQQGRITPVEITEQISPCNDRNADNERNRAAGNDDACRHGVDLPRFFRAAPSKQAAYRSRSNPAGGGRQRRRAGSDRSCNRHREQDDRQDEEQQQRDRAIVQANAAEPD